MTDAGSDVLGRVSRAELLDLGTATLYEAAGLDCYLPSDLRPVWTTATVVGRALPVSLAAADNLPLHLALEHARPGDVLVADGQRERCGYWGEVLATAAQVRGVRGLIIDGGVRDTEALTRLGFATFSSSVAIRGTAKQDRGRIGSPIQLGRVTVQQGDLVIADADGAVVLPATRVDDVLAAARVRAQTEREYLERIHGGELTVDIYQLREAHLAATS